jgi:hypothetical protein
VLIGVTAPSHATFDPPKPTQAGRCTDDPDAFVAEFVRLVEALPQNVLVVDIRGNGLDRADVLVDGRPRASVDLPGATATITLPGVAATATVRVNGYAAGSLVAARSLPAVRV